jgi:DNA-binding NarL/FixJ family response regulator
MTIRVAIADDQAMVRAGFRLIVGSQPDMEVAGEAGDGQAAVDLVRHERPDVILMDIRMPGLDGVEATRRIAGDVRLSAVRILILTTFESDEYVFEALRAGASGFLVKDGDTAEVLRAVRVVAAGEALLSPGATRRLVEELTTRPERARLAPELLGELTDREREVMALVAYGLTNREIAERLVISPATAKAHVSRTMLKLHAHNRAQLVATAYQTGLVVHGGSAESVAADRIAGRVPWLHLERAPG